MEKSIKKKKERKRWIKPTIIITLFTTFLIFGVWAMANNFTYQTFILDNLNQEGISSYVGESVVTYTPTTDTTCNDGICTKILWSGIKNIYEDNEWKRVEDAKSLKDVWITEYLEIDPDFDIKVLKVNYTDLILNFSFNHLSWESYPECFGDWTDIKCDFKLSVKTNVCNETDCWKEEEKFQYKYQLKDNILKENLKYTQKGIALGRTYKFGGNSTTIQLQDANTENLEDTFTNEAAASTNYGSDVELLIRNLVVAGDKHNIYKFNMTSVLSASSILNSQFYINILANGLDASTEGFNLSVHHHYNQSWIETYVTYNNMNTLGNYNNTAESIYNIFGGSGEPIGWLSLNTTNSVTSSFNDGENNISFYLLAIDVYGTPGGGDDLNVASKEYATISLRPYLNITYEEGGADTCTCAGVGNDWEVDMGDYCFISDNCVVDALTFINTGNFTCDAIINVSSIEGLDVGQRGYSTSSCRGIIR